MTNKDDIPTPETVLDRLHTTAQFQALTNPNQRHFLSVFSVCGKIKTASEKSGIARENHYYWMHNDEVYKKAYASCRDTIAAMIEDSLVHQLIYGIEELTYEAGEDGELVLVRRRVRHDLNAMLKYLAKAKPAVFGEKIELDATLEGISPEAMVAAMAATVPYCPEPLVNGN